jgi:hypothetical protein
MANPRKPKQSGSQAQLAAASAFLDLAATSQLHPDLFLQAAYTIINEVKVLQPYQQEELFAFLRDRLARRDGYWPEEGPEPELVGAVSATIDLDDESETERDLRQAAAVDQLVNDRQLSITDAAEDPRAAADELAARVRGSDVDD